MKKFFSSLVIIGLLLLNTLPVFAQLGGVTPPPVETPPAPPAPPAPHVEPAPPAVTEPVVQIVTSPADTTGPVISGVASLSLATHDATLVWTTDELAISTFEYGTTQSYGSNPTIAATALLAHTAILTGLIPGTTYYYCIHTHDLANNVTNSCDHTFTTASQTVIVDTTPPDVSLITVASITTTGATINFTTSEVGNARIEYGTTAGYGESTNLNTTLALTHAVALSGLTPNTLYHYRIITSDELGNETITSDETLMTESISSPAPINVQAQVQTPADTIPPIISGIGTASLGITDVTLAWDTNELAVSTLEYGTTQSYGSHATLSLSALLAHSAILTGLTAGTTYYYCIHATDIAGNSATSCPHSFTTETVGTVGEIITSQAPQTIPQAPPVLISGIEAASVSTSTVTIAWNTDLPSDSEVEYGNSENFGSLTPLDSTLTTSHSVTITGLTPNTGYIFRVKSKPLGASVATVSPNDEFATLTYSIPIVPPANITSVSSGSVTNTGVAISWTTDKGATSQVEYGPLTVYGSSSANTETLVTSHSISLNNLNSGTTYHYRVKSTDEVGNVTFSEDYTFTTTGSSSNISTTPPAPVVTDESETPIVDVTGADHEVVFEINDGNPGVNEDVVVERDSQVIYEGNSETFTDTNVINGVSHNYTVFARSSGGGSSRAVNITIAPVAGVRQVKFNESGTLASSTPVLHFVETWQKGNKDIEIEHLQELLAADKDSYPEKYITGYFGSLTEAALKRFQTKHRLPQTGIVDAATQKELNTISLSETKLDIPADVIVFDTDLKKGDQGEDVEDLQQYLIYEGSYQEAIISGYFGNLTEGAVKTFQTKYNIAPVSGYVGYKTRHKMQQLVGL